MLGRLAAISKRFAPAATARREVTPAPAEIIPPLTIDAEPMWSPATQMRRMAEEYRAGRSPWVIASDMDEFFRSVDAYNARVADDDKIHLEILGNIGRELRRLLDSRAGLNLNSPLAAFGPPGVGGLRVRVGLYTAPVEYVYDGLESYLRVERPNGRADKWHFGMAESVFAAKFARLKSSGLLALRGPAPDIAAVPAVA